MEAQDFSALIETLTVKGAILPVGVKELDAYERQTGLRLPNSYRAYCQVFGPGKLAGWFEIAVPGHAGHWTDRYDLATRNASYREWTEWKEYITDQDQIRRAVLFAGDETSAVYFWDPAQPTVAGKNELGIYVVWRDYTVERVCDTFWEFTQICLHMGKRTLDGDNPPPMVFEPVWQGRPTWP